MTEVKEGKDAAGSPHVDAVAERQAEEYLWSPVRRRLQDHPCSESGIHRGQTKVYQLNFPVLLADKHDVVRFEITVHDTSLSQGVYSL